MIDQDLLETVAAANHQGWIRQKLADGISSRKSESGEEYMVPYDQLSEPAKELDRSTVRSVLAAIEEAGYRLVKTP